MQFSEEERGMWLEDWQQSGRSAWAYAKENGLNPQTFIRWTRTEPKAKIRPGERKMSFAEVPSQIVPSPQQVTEILIEKGDVKIHIPLVMGRNELRAVMEGLGGVL